MKTELKRRDLLGSSVAVVASGLLGSRPASAERRPLRSLPRPEQFRFGLNTSTIRGQKLSIVEEIAIAAKAGYQALEPWIDELERYEQAGGSLEDLGKRLKDAGITVESAIGFSEWIVDDPDRRKRGLESVRRAMELVRRIGGTRLAAPPVGATDRAMPDLLKVADRYRAILELGDQIGVVPEVEIWGQSRTLGRLGEAAFVAIESGHPKACILPDVYHLYRGGSERRGHQALEPERDPRHSLERLPRRPAPGQDHRCRPSVSRRWNRTFGEAARHPGRGRLSGHALARAFQPEVLERGSAHRRQDGT